jgi:hypothetical protein
MPLLCDPVLTLSLYLWLPYWADLSDPLGTSFVATFPLTFLAPPSKSHHHPMAILRFVMTMQGRGSDNPPYRMWFYRLQRISEAVCSRSLSLQMKHWDQRSCFVCRPWAWSSFLLFAAYLVHPQECRFLQQDALHCVQDMQRWFLPRKTQCLWGSPSLLVLILAEELLNI